jgi:hypothetical protein
MEKVLCECCGFTEDYTPAYIASVRAGHMGRWVCGLCVEAVGDEVRRAGVDERITTTEALDRGGRPHRDRRAAAPALPPRRCRRRTRRG